MSAETLIGALIAGVPGSAAVMADYLTERGWDPGPMESEAPSEPLDARAAVMVARLVTLDDWSSEALISLACDIAEHFLGPFEFTFPDDGRPRAAIVARRAGEPLHEANAAAREAHSLVERYPWQVPAARWATQFSIYAAALVSSSGFDEKRLRGLPAMLIQGAAEGWRAHRGWRVDWAALAAMVARALDSELAGC